MKQYKVLAGHYVYYFDLASEAVAKCSDAAFYKKHFYLIKKNKDRLQIMLAHMTQMQEIQETRRNIQATINRKRERRDSRGLRI